MDSRILEPEVMDQPDLDPALHRQALRGLGRVNWWSRTARILWNRIELVVQRNKLPNVSVLDLACGGGDVTLAVAALATKKHISLRIHGWDKSATAIEFARDRARRAGDSAQSSPNACTAEISFEQHDVFEDASLSQDDLRRDSQYDVVYSSLFLHHLTEEDAVRLMMRMKEQARYLVLIDDLYRSRAGYVLAQTACRLLSRSPVVHTDGPLSVRAAFRKQEVLQLASQAGWNEVQFQRHWPLRFLLSGRQAI